MSILYRAVWSDGAITDVGHALEALRTRVAGWTQESAEPAPLTEGQSEFRVSQRRQRRVTHRSIGDEGFEVIATDQIPGDPTEWVTTVRVVAEGEQLHTLVELSMSSDDLMRRVVVGRPGVVRELLDAATKPRLAGSAVLSAPLEVPASQITALTDLLASPERALPFIICAEPSGEHDGLWLKLADKIGTRAEGVAMVLTLDREAVYAFRREFGSLAIWDGGIRVYAPGSVTPGSDGWRHRYYVRSRLQEATQPTIDRIVYSVAQLSTRRRVPSVFAAFGEQAGLPADSLDGMIPAAELTRALEAWEHERAVALDEQSAVEKELAGANGHLSRLKDALVEQGLRDLIWGTKHEDGASIPDEVQDTSEAVMAAQAYLSDWLVLPDSAVRELEDIDAAPESYNWGNKTWRGLRALAAYAKDRAEGWDAGGYWEWCASGPLLGWPASPKKLSMTESETVQNNARLSRTRVFKIDTRVDVSGELTMLAHLKISEGGGSMAPRVYFHDDTGGSTEKVHVGFVGPHSLVPNKSAN